jgi:uncharacterized protein (TIGR02246 family)
MTPGVPLTPDQLVEVEAICRVKYAYARCVDQKNWDDLATLLTEDCVADYSNGKYHHEGRDGIVAWIRGGMEAETFLSSHKMHHPEIELTGPDTATGTWALEDTVIESQWQIIIRGAAFYTDEYVKRDGRWMISRTAYKRSYETMEPWTGTPGLQLTASWWGTNGQSTIDA